MQNSSEFQYIAIDTIHESATNPRRTFDEVKLYELGESIRSNGLIQPITVRPNTDGFEIVAGARRFRAAQLAELFSLPARIVDITDAQALEWQLVENSQRVDVHPYEEAQGFQRLLNMPGYDVATLVEKSGKSTSHIYARLSLLQLIPEVAEAFTYGRITASHASLIARLPKESQAAAYEQCWRKDWQDSEAHLLPAKHLSAWIQANLYLSLADAPFDRKDLTLNPASGACVTCPRRSGYNTSLFADVQGDQCLDAPCYQSKVAAHIERELAAYPNLIQIETTWRSPKEQTAGALTRGKYRELPQSIASENLDAEPVRSCDAERNALVVFGKGVGKTVPVCTDPDCPVHTNRLQRQQVETTAIAPVSSQPGAEERSSPEEANEQRQQFQREQEKRDETRKQEFQRQQEEYQAEQNRTTELQKTRKAMFTRILDNTPAMFNAVQLRVFLRALVNLDPYDFAEDVAEHYASGDENDQRTPEEVLISTLDTLADDKLTSFALRLALTGHLYIPREGDHDFLAEAENAFAPPKLRTPASPKKVAKTAEAKKLTAKHGPKKRIAA